MASTPTSDAAVLTVEEAAKLLRIGRNAAYSAVKRGEIRAVKIGRSLRVPRAELDRLLSAAGDQQ